MTPKTSLTLLARRLLLAPFSLWSFIAFACDCPLLTEEHQFCRAHEIVYGTILMTTEVRDDTAPFIPYSLSFSQSNVRRHISIAELEVVTAFKGDPAKRLMVFTSGSESSCGVRFSIGDNVLLNISPTGSVSLCSGSHFDINNTTPAGASIISAEARRRDKWASDPSAFCKEFGADE